MIKVLAVGKCIRGRVIITKYLTKDDKHAY